ncbi:MAG: glycosyltransferase, partial [Janthinobacterium lividum]
MTAPSISIAMATYNGARYLRQQLDSLARQTYLPAELVVTDDMSTDGTEAVVMEFAATAPFPVRFFRNEQRLGYRHNFTRAVSYCTSDLIAF